MEDFIKYLKTEKNKAENTLIAYRRDIKAFSDFLAQRGKNLRDCMENDAIAYVMELSSDGKSSATINRKISALRGCFEYLIAQGEVGEDPFSKVRRAVPMGEETAVESLSTEEINALMDAPDVSRPGGIRDRALLELMYGTGIRVSEVTRLTVGDVNLRMGFITVTDGTDERRIIPLGKYAAAAVRDYLEKGRPAMAGKDMDPDGRLFVNSGGTGLSRQSIWKMLKKYGETIGAADRMTPAILRDTFAVHMLQNGADLRTLQELMGFDDMSKGVRYLSALEIKVREVFMKTHPRA